MRTSNGVYKYFYHNEVQYVNKRLKFSEIRTIISSAFALLQTFVQNYRKTKNRKTGNNAIIAEENI